MIKKYLLFVIPILFLGISKVNALSFDLHPNQYVHTISSSGKMNYYSTTWGNSISVDKYRQVYSFGAYVYNPMSQMDHLVTSNNSYIVQFVINSSVAFQPNSHIQENFGSNASAHVLLSYLNTSNKKTWLEISNSKISNYNLSKINNFSYLVSFVFEAPEMPNNSNTMEFIDIDTYITSLDVSTAKSLVYSGNSSIKAGISSFNISLATDDAIRDLLNGKLNSSLIDGLDDLKNQQQETNNKLDDLKGKQEETNNYLKDDTPPNSDISALGNVQGLLPAGPLDSLLNIPFNFLSIVVSSLSGTCVALESNFVFDTNLTFPCFTSFYDSVPTGIMVFINIIPSAFILIIYFKHLYKKVDRAMSLESNSDDEWGVI